MFTSKSICIVHNGIIFLAQIVGSQGHLSFQINWKAVKSSVSTNFTLKVPQVWQKFAWWRLGCLHQIIDINMEIIIKLYEIDRGFGFNLMNDHASPF